MEMQQAMQPFQLASMMQGFNEKEASIDKDNAMAAYYRAGGRQAAASVDQWQDSEGRLWRLTPEGAVPITPFGGGEQLTGRVPVAGDGMGWEQEIVMGQLGPRPGQPGSRFASDAEYMAAAQDLTTKLRASYAGAGAGAAAGARLGVDLSNGGLTDRDRLTIDQYNRQLNEIDNALADIGKLKLRESRDRFGLGDAGRAAHAAEVQKLRNAKAALENQRASFLQSKGAGVVPPMGGPAVAPTSQQTPPPAPPSQKGRPQIVISPTGEIVIR